LVLSAQGLRWAEVAALGVAFSGKASVSVPAAIGGDGSVELKVLMEEVMVF